MAQAISFGTIHLPPSLYSLQQHGSKTPSLDAGRVRPVVGIDDVVVVLDLIRSRARRLLMNDVGSWGLSGLAL
jgi:hypothetical protein